MKVGVLGSGTVAQTLASGFLKHSHAVIVGTRTPAKLAEWMAQNEGAQVGSLADAAKFGDLIVLAVKGNAAAEALRQAGASNLERKAVMDVCNPIADAPPDHGVLRFFTTHDDSLMEQLQREFPAAHLVKVFNSVGAPSMVNPQFASGKPTMFICGNDESAKKQVSEVAGEFGWEVADMGGVESARAIEPLCMLWCIQGFVRNEWTHAFKLLHR
jgi:predicted dinucleotide-binding enzyme